VDVRIEKRKWDGTLSAVYDGALLERTGGVVAWWVPAGTVRSKPAREEVEVVADDEIWLAVPGEWWVLCARSEQGTVNDCVLHAAAPFQIPAADRVLWTDLDLDFEVRGSEIAVEDEVQFHEHAKSMAYPDEVVRGAWSGISAIAPRYTTGEWPFDGWLQSRLDRARAEPSR
jgi:protein associated with RNAse G/E